jgi:NTE family protein
MPPASGPVGLVLAGGGARGAYEVGALAELAPALEARGERVEIVVGTSAGALNAAFLAAGAHRPLGEVLADGIRTWRSIHFRDVLAPLLSPGGAVRLARYLLQIGGFPGARLDALLDPSPLAATLRRLIDPDQIARNVRTRAVLAAGVVATANRTGRSVVFHAGGGRPGPDAGRGIDYVATRLGLEHVRASAAIPTLFPAVEVERPASHRGWYFDGGTRLNTPIKPVLALGARRVIVIGLNTVGGPAPRRHAEARPDAFEGAAHILQALLADPLAHDVRTLARTNELVARSEAAGRRTTIPYIFVAPRGRDALGSPDLALLGRLIAGGEGPIHGELLSYLFFAPEFADALISLGREDARRWLDGEHWDGPWRCAPPAEE